MTIKTIFLFIFCILIWLSEAVAQQNINFTSLTTKLGLSSNRVNAIQKDHYGLMWFGTEDGLNKFDGSNFTVYRRRSADSASLQANEILSLHEDRSGNLWVGTGGGSLSLYDRQKDAFVHFPANGGENGIDNGVILSVCHDYRGKLWIGHYNGINILDPQTRTITKFYTAPHKAFEKTSLRLFEDSRHQMWIGTNNGLFRYNPLNNSLTGFLHTPKEPAGISGSTILAITEDKQKNIWIGTNGGLSMLRPDGTFVNYNHQEANESSLSDNTVNALAVDDENKLWIGTGAGLNILDIGTGKIIKLTSDPRNVHSLNTSSIRSIYIDGQGIYWIGNFNGGVNKYDRNLNLFNLVLSNPFDEHGLRAPIVTAFAEATNGKVFVGTDDGGVSLFDPVTNTFRGLDIRSKQQTAKKQLDVLALKMTGNRQLLIGTFSDGLFVLDPATGRYQQLMQGEHAGELNSNAIFCISEDRKGNRWIGTNGEGINVLNSENKVIARYTPNPKAATDVKLPVNGYIRDIIEDRNGNFWIGTHGGGIAYLKPSSGEFVVYKTSNSILPNDKVQSLLEDSRGNIWIGTLGGGLGLFRPHTKQFTVISEREGLPNNNVYKILEDKNGLLWISTNKGISSYNQDTRKMNHYNYHHGIQQNNFVNGSGLRSSGGYLYFGGVDGFNFFNPAFLKINNHIPAILITDLKISNKSVAPSEDGPIKENISVAKRIDLDYKQNFALSFVGLNYTAPGQNQYAYKLERFDKDWNYTGNATTAVYTNLDPGEYVFRVRASNNDGIWNTAGSSIKIFVHPPFWRTVYAYLFYIILIAGLLLYHRYRSIQKIKRKYILEQEKARASQERKEAERLHELDQLKIKFLTNLSHEFRTPISLILGPVDMLLSQEKTGRYADQLNMIKRNARRLLNLVNQLLDFRKMEENELKLHLSEGELVSFVKEVFDSFKDLAERKKISYVFTSHLNSFPTCFDQDKVERILFNILSNAFKFTLEGGKISLEINCREIPADPAKTWIAIGIKDSGIGIPEDKKEKIFERFFQNTTASSILNQGTGLGLSITKEFVKMQGGTISVDSEPGCGSTFLIQLPFQQREIIAENGALQPELPAPGLAAAEEKQFAAANKGDQIKPWPEMPTVLLVEDNEDFRFYLKDNLRLQYKVLEAANGKEGWQKALAEHPQLIVSDISMPSMDGLELCMKIKSDKRTNHIPVILLTAITGEKDQLKGLETGANDYITKPFNFELLNAKIKNLLVLNQSLKNTYTKQIKVLNPEINIESADEKLMQKIMVYIEDNLTETQLSVENLSKHVGMSRSSLYSKLVALTGQTPVEFIRSVKLDKAAVLLEKSDMTIAQIAYSVGFSTPNYFTKSFKEKFNVLPSEYLNKLKSEGGNKV